MKKYKYGELNQTSRNDYLKQFDTVRQDPFDIVSMAVTEGLTIEQDRKGPFRAQVLRVIKNAPPPFDPDNIIASIGQSLRNLGNRIGITSNQHWAVKARIPELNSHLPYPNSLVTTIMLDEKQPNVLTKEAAKNNADFFKIEMHDTYYPSVKGMPEPTAGDIVWVEFKNGRGYVVDLDRDGNNTSNSTPPSGSSGTGSGQIGSRPSTPAIYPNDPPGDPPTGASQLKPQAATSPNEDEAKKYIARVNAVHGNNYINPDKWEEFIHYDILTKEFNGLELTLLRSEVPVYEAMIKDFQDTYKTITGNDIVMKHKVGETFRLVCSKGGSFFSSSKPNKNKPDGAQHGKGTAIDLPHRPLRSGTAGSKKSRAQVSLFFQVALKHGYRGFGVGANIVHIDRRANHAFWSYSKIKDEDGSDISSSDTKKIVLRAAQMGDSSPMPIPEEWLNATGDDRESAAEAAKKISNRVFTRDDLI